MLNSEGCQELTWLRDLAGFHDATVLEDVPEGVHRLAGRIVRKWWKPHDLHEALCRLEAAHVSRVSDSGI
jgi:hypothetical protein